MTYRKKVNQKGTSILVVVSVLSILMLLGFSTYKSLLFIIEFANASIAMEQEYRLCQGILECGISYAKHHYEDLTQNVTITEFEIGLDTYRGFLSLHSKKDGINIQSMLTNKDILRNELSCRLLKNVEQKLLIQDFQRAKSPLY